MFSRKCPAHAEAASIIGRNRRTGSGDGVCLSDRLPMPAPVGFQVELHGLLHMAVGGKRERPGQRAHDVIVMQRALRVLARADCRDQTVFVQRDVHRVVRSGVHRAGSRLAGIDLCLPALRIARIERQPQRRLTARRGRAQRRFIAAKVCAVEHELRRVDPAAMRIARTLAGRERGLRIRIAPAQRIPVIDMKRERHDVTRFERLRG